MGKKFGKKYKTKNWINATGNKSLTLDIWDFL